MNYGIGNVKGKGGGGKTYFYADFDDLTYDSQNDRYTIDKDDVWCNFLSTLQTSNDFKVGDFLYACDFNVNGNGMVKLLLEITNVGSNDLTLSECLDYAEQSSGIYYTMATLNAVGQTTQVALSNIQVNTNNSRNVLHENDLIIDANKKVGGVVSISNGVATIFTIMELGGGGKQLYQHNITINYQTLWCKFSIINDSATAMTFENVSQYLIDKGLTLNNRTLVATGHFFDNNVNKTIIGIFNSSIYTDRIYPSMLDSSGNESHANYMSSGASLFDAVITL